MTWPRDADGDVFRRLQTRNFDFDVLHKIDFQIDFDTWPPSDKAVALLKRTFADVDICDPEADSAGYIEVSIVDRLTYEFVTGAQANISRLLTAFGGRCEAWGVLGDK